jgi:hypothetical protein
MRRLLILCTLAACARPGPNPADAPASDAESAARTLVASLPDTDRRLIAMPFDSAERMRWNFVPLEQRAGVPIGRFTSAQRANLDALLGTALSERGVTLAHAIMHHEGILKAVETARGISPRIARDSARYYTSVFGTPSTDSVWGWRVEGHHLSVNVTRLGRDAQAVAPLFMGANPARVPSGPSAGLRLLAAEEDLGRALVTMLAPERRARAVIADTTFGEIVTRNDPKVQPLARAGLAAADMTPDERAQLRRLIDVYATRMAPAAARDQLARIERAGFGALHFAWAGSLAPGRPHYYRVHGPTVLIEYDDTQSNANHVHTVWRDLERDFGGDLLRAHYAKHRHPHD